MAGRRILLLEPAYKNKYPPLGLMKLAAYHGPYGKNDEVTFIKGHDPKALETAWDRVYVTTLFPFEFKCIADEIDFALLAAGGRSDRVFVGGIAASLMTQKFLVEPRWRGVRFITGLLTEAPAVALKLDAFNDELYADDIDGTPIEDLIPDYSIIDQVDYKYPVHDAYFAYASRGCIRKCHFCGVPKLEGGQRDTESLTTYVEGIKARHGEKRDLTLMDNNVVASSRFEDIIAEIRDLGFQAGATLKRKDERVASKRRVDFNQGVDARILCKDPKYLRELSTIALKPLRIAFDHLGLRKPYEQAIRYSADAGLRELSNYMLYNFRDTPTDLFARMWLNVQLNEELDIRIWSFPMRYQPTDMPARTFVSENWTRYQLRSLQLILQATHGIVSGAPAYFKRAFGESAEAFEDLLLMPQHFIFNREWFESLGGRPQLDEFRAEFAKLSPSTRRDLLHRLSSAEPSQWASLRDGETDPQIRAILNFYIPMPKAEERAIWERQKAAKAMPSVPADEMVEDAGLNEDGPDYDSQEMAA
jgi:hypothetical protein